MNRSRTTLDAEAASHFFDLDDFEFNDEEKMTECKRRYERAPFFESCTVLRNSGRSVTCYTLDLGAGGFAFRCDQRFLKGEQLTAIFGGNTKEKCIVAYCEEYEKDKYRVGVNFEKARRA